MPSSISRSSGFISFGIVVLAGLTAPGVTGANAADTGSTAAAAAAAVGVVSPTNTPSTATVTAAIVAPGETAVTLDINFGVRFVPVSRVAVPAGELLRVSAPNLGPLQWRKDGKPIAGATNATLVLESVQSTDAGIYSAIYTDPAMAGRGSQAMSLSVGPGERLLNLSTRAHLAAGPGQSVLAGFVVAGGNAKRIILRAVGPTLATFGITNPLKQPVLRVLDAKGKPYENGYVYPAIVGGPTYDSDLAASLARCGAFPIPSGTADVTLMMPFIPGNYVAEVTSRDETAGTVLLEVYEVP